MNSVQRVHLTKKHKLFFLCRLKTDLVHLRGERGEEASESGGEPPEDGREPRALAPAEGHDQGRQEQTEGHAQRAQPHCKRERGE